MTLEEIKVDIDDAPDTQVRPSITHGLGLFAVRDFTPGEIVVDYGQNIAGWREKNYLDLNKEYKDNNWFIMLDSKRCLTTDKYSKFSYINHNRFPNCYWDLEKHIIVAKVPIYKNQELFIDYRLEPQPEGAEQAKWK
jgi:SET domain-containing protein